MADGRPLDGVVAVVTGGSRGIGAAITVRLAELGAVVGVLYRSDHESAAGVVGAVEAAGSKALPLQADVADAVAVGRAFDTVEARFGRVGVLVNNAGCHRGGRISALRVGDWRTVIDTNLTGSFLCCQRVVPGMVGGRAGRIVNVGSVVGLNGFPGDTAYAAAKAGLVGLTKSLALELARDGISVNALIPGFVDTEMTRGLDPAVLERVVRSIPAGRQATPSEVADAAALLVTGPAYLTGATLVLDGGWTIA